MCLAALLLSAQAAQASSFIYWSEDTRLTTRERHIMRAETDGANIETILSEPIGGENVFGGIAFDPANGHFYSGTAGALFRANLDGSGRVNLVPAVNQVADVELDLADGKIYWSEAGGGVNAIYRANLDGSGKETLRNIGFAGGIEGIALDLTARKLFFQENINVGDDTIQSMNLDGSGVSVFKTLAGNLANPHDVEINPALGKLYWNQTFTVDGIFQANLDGSGGYGLQVDPPDGAANGFHFDALTQKLFVSGTAADRIQSLNLDGSDFTTLVPGRTFVNYLEVVNLATVPDGGMGLLGFSMTVLALVMGRAKVNGFLIPARSLEDASV